MPDELETPLETDHFFCVKRKKNVLLGECLEEYMNVNAFVDKKSPCYDCPQGKSNRYCFGHGQPLEKTAPSK